jgi:hypothetical protein
MNSLLAVIVTSLGEIGGGTLGCGFDVGPCDLDPGAA